MGGDNQKAVTIFELDNAGHKNMPGLQSTKNNFSLLQTSKQAGGPC